MSNTPPYPFDSPSMQSISVGTELDLTLIRNNDYSLAFQVDSGWQMYNLASATLTFYLKASSTATDGSGFNNTPSVTNASLGQFTVTIPRAQLATAGTMFYHVDAVASSLTTTLLYGNVNVVQI